MIGWGRIVVAGVAVVVLLLGGCGVVVRPDASRVGGGPGQATAIAEVSMRATVVGMATARAVSGISDASQVTPCDCSPGG